MTKATYKRICLFHGSRGLESIIVGIAWLYVAGMVAETGNQSSYLETQA